MRSFAFSGAGRRSAVCATIALVAACTSESPDESTGYLDSGAGGSVSGSGGLPSSTGGASGRGTGGRTATGGASLVGGGGSSGAGGNSAGGATAGGSVGSGGASSDASVGSGGAQSTGGAQSAGGAQSTGGAQSAGGAQSTGGAPNTGGAPGTGGQCTCASGGSSSTDGGAPLPVVGGCPIFTADDAWNRDITGDPVDANWTTKLYANATLKVLHPDFGTSFGIPFNVVPQNQTPLSITFDYAGESDPSPYPFPGSSAKIEGGTPTNCSGDCHVLTVQQGTCLLYEGWACSYNSGSSSWHCGSGAKFDLTKNSYGQRPLYWTSADAAGLAILPGLVRYSEVAAGAVNHAIRFTMHCTQDGFVNPASHEAVPGGTRGCPAGITSTQLRAEYPPMGLRIRLKSTYDISSLATQARVVAKAMQTYGMILADNGSDYFFQGDEDPGWNDSQLNGLKTIPGDAFEVMVPGTITR